MHTEISKLSTVYDITKRYKIFHKLAGTIITLRDLMAQIIKDNSMDVPSGQEIDAGIAIQFPAPSISIRRITYSGYIIFGSNPKQPEESSDAAIHITYISYISSL
jgi:hypothetical protein